MKSGKHTLCNSNAGVVQLMDLPTSSHLTVYNTVGPVMAKQAANGTQKQALRCHKALI